MLTSKYGKPYADACRASVHPANVSEKLQHKMSIQAPPKLLVEKYLIEIAKIFNIDYEPDQSIMQSDHSRPDGFLIDLNDKNNLDGNIPAPPGPGFAQFPQPPPLPIMPHPPANIPFNYPGSQRLLILVCARSFYVLLSLLSLDKNRGGISTNRCLHHILRLARTTIFR